jgi:hypothetical protein
VSISFQKTLPLFFFSLYKSKPEVKLCASVYYKYHNTLLMPNLFYCYRTWHNYFYNIIVFWNQEWICDGKSAINIFEVWIVAKFCTYSSYVQIFDDQKMPCDFFVLNEYTVVFWYILFSLYSDKYTRFCQWKNLELNIQVRMQFVILFKLSVCEMFELIEIASWIFLEFGI